MEHVLSHLTRRYTDQPIGHYSIVAETSTDLFTYVIDPHFLNCYGHVQNVANYVMYAPISVKTQILANSLQYIETVKGSFSKLVQIVLCMCLIEDATEFNPTLDIFILLILKDYALIFDRIVHLNLPITRYKDPLERYKKFGVLSIDDREYIELNH